MSKLAKERQQRLIEIHDKFISTGGIPKRELIAQVVVSFGLSRRQAVEEVEDLVLAAKNLKEENGKVYKYE